MIEKPGAIQSPIHATELEYIARHESANHWLEPFADSEIFDFGLIP
jgi:hypothetical protein